MLVLLQGCAGVALTAAGVGGGVAASHEMGGHAYRTFTAPQLRVHGAVIAALNKMVIKPGKTEKTDSGEKIITKANERNIEIELEALSPNTTRVEAVVRTSGGFVDAATAVEIINQTEAAFGRN